MTKAEKTILLQYIEEADRNEAQAWKSHKHEECVKWICVKHTLVQLLHDLKQYPE